MRRFSVLAVLLLLAFPAGLSVIGCGGNPTHFCSGNTNGLRLTDVATITLEPKLFGVSLHYGQTSAGGVGLSSPIALNCQNQTVSPGRFTYATSDKTIADINPSTGEICGGTFNRNSGNGVQDFTICNATNQTGTATVTANAGGASSNQVTVYVHPQVSRTQLFTAGACDPNNPSSNCCPQSQQPGTTVPIYTGASCLSQNQTAQLGIQAFDAQGNNITCSVGHFVFTPEANTAAAAGTSVVSFDSNGIATAIQPGTVSITATAANEGSTAGTFSTCPPASIALTGPANDGTNLTINLNNTRQLQTTVLDTNGKAITGLQLTYTSTLPLEIPVTTGSGSVTPAFPASASITAACLPPTCNPSPYPQIGLFGTGKPIFSNPVQVHTPGTASSLLYLASTQSPSFSVIDFTNPTSGTAARLPFTPNSLVLSQDGTTLYFGSATALMTVSTGTNTLLDQNLNVPGNVLAVSPDNTRVLISDSSRGVFYIYAPKTKAFQTYGGTGTRAEWSKDGTTVYIAGGNTMYIYNVFTGFQTFDAASVLAIDVAITVPAEAAFFAGTMTTARGACPQTTPPPPDYYPPAASAAANTDRIVATNDGKHILGVGATNTFSDINVTLPGASCPATTGITIPANPYQTALAGVNASAFNSVVASPDSTLAVVTYTPSGSTPDAPLPVYHIPATTLGTLQNVALAGGATAPVSAVFSPDETAIFVATAGDDKLHVIALPALSDAQQITTNLVDPNNQPVAADLIAVRPRPVT